MAIEKIGNGFLDANGQVKDRKVIEKENSKKTDSKIDSSSKADRTNEDEQSLSSGLKSVRGKFAENVNSVVSVINQDQENLKKASKNVKKQIEVAKELKEALKDSDQKKIEKKQAELIDLQAKRDEIALEIENDNKESAENRVKNINLGNQQKKIVKLEKVEFEKSKEDLDLSKVKDVNKLIDDLKVDRDNLKSQTQDLRDTKKEVKNILDEGKKDLERIESKSILSFEEARQNADKIASSIISAGAEKALVSNIEQSVAEQLLAA